MIKYADYKAPGKKLIRIKVEMEGDIIKTCQINGDFFIFPMEGQEILEEALINMPLNIKKIDKALNEAAKKNGIEILGVNIEDITDTFKKIQID